MELYEWEAGEMGTLLAVNKEGMEGSVVYFYSV